MAQLPADEVLTHEAVEHLKTCDSPPCAMWRHVQEVVAAGTPAQRRNLLGALHALVHELAPHVILDDLRDLG